MTSSSAAAGFIVGAASIALFITSAAVATREFAAARDSISNADWTGRLVAGNVVLGISTALQRDDLIDCYDAMEAGDVPGRSIIERHQIAKTCSDMAMGIVEWSPSNSLGWLIGAAGSAQLGDFQAFNARLLQSQVTGAYEQWVGEVRVEVAETYFDKLDPQTRANHLADLSMLVRSLSGIRSIAQRYLDDQDFQERIVRIVETLPEAEQQRFLDTVKQVAFDPATRGR